MSRTHTFPVLAAILLGPAIAVAQAPPGPGVLRVPRPLDPSDVSDESSSPAGLFRPGSAGPYAVTADSPSPLLVPEPVLLARPGTETGWYGTVTLGLVRPHITNRVTSGTPLDPAFPAPVEVPIASLNWTVSPRFELGYRLPDGCGDLRLGYRFLVTTGTEDGLQGDLRSRLDLNVIDLDYVSPEWLVENPLGPFRDLRLVFGVRIAASYFDSISGGSVVEDRFSSHFVGAGPRFGLEWRKPVLAGPLELYARVDATGLLGRTRQDFSLAARDDAGRVFGATRRGNPQSNGVAVLGTEVGLAWRPDPGGRLRFAVGYQFEQWWNIGRTNDSNAELTIQGVFLRGEWRY